MALKSADKSVGLASTTVIEARDTGTFFSIQNLDPTNPIYVRMGDDAATTVTGIKVLAGEYLETNTAQNRGAVQAIATGAPVDVVFTIG